VLGQADKNQKDLVRSMGWEPDAIYDTKTGKTVPIDAALTTDAAVFTNQGVPMTSGRYADGGGDLDPGGQPEGKVEFNTPTHRSEENNAPFKGRSGDPYAGMPGSK
jgi:hypothetical protein